MSIETIKKYLSENYPKLTLTENQFAQLLYYDTNPTTTPEARVAVSAELNFEATRTLARLNSFELLLCGNDDAYAEFIKGQAENKQLRRDNFDLLSKEAKNLDEDLKQAIRAGCFLTKSKPADAILEKHGIHPQEDSEAFLTQIAKLHPDILKEVMPATKDLSEKQKELLVSMFWLNTHFRHMLFTEGGSNMTQNLCKGLETRDFNFQAWRWRWLTNLFGFHGGPGAKFFNNEFYRLTVAVFEQLHNTEGFTTQYLQVRAGIAGVTTKSNLSRIEELLIGHIAAMFFSVNILDSEAGKHVIAGYGQYKLDYPGTTLAATYVKYCNNPAAITPTYVPAVLNGVYDLLLKDPEIKNLTTQNPLELATIFSCQVMQELYSHAQTYKEQPISCAALAKGTNLKTVVIAWLTGDKTLELDTRNPYELSYQPMGLVPTMSRS